MTTQQDRIETITELVEKAKAGIHDNGYRIGRVAAANKHSETEKGHALHFQGLAYQQLVEALKELHKLKTSFEGSPTELLFGAESAQDGLEGETNND